MKVRDQVVLHVTVSDKDAPVTWYKNGQPVDIDDWARYDVISEGKSKLSPNRTEIKNQNQIKVEPKSKTLFQVLIVN